MTDRELMQQALDALRDADNYCPVNSEAEVLVRLVIAIAALRERLAQPEQEHVIDCPRCGHYCPQSIVSGS